MNFIKKILTTCRNVIASPGFTAFFFYRKIFNKNSSQRSHKIAYTIDRIFSYREWIKSLKGLLRRSFKNVKKIYKFAHTIVKKIQTLSNRIKNIKFLRPKKNKWTHKYPFLYFEWAITDLCNLNCSYCIVKKRGSHKSSNDHIEYYPGNEIKIAKKIVQISKTATYTRVNITGGEPLTTKYIKDVLKILTSKQNIDVLIITNFILADKIKKFFGKLERVTISTHLPCRTSKQKEQLLHNIEKYHAKILTRSKQALIPTVVDKDLSEEDEQILQQIKTITGIPLISRTKYIPPPNNDKTPTHKASKRGIIKHLIQYLSIQLDRLLLLFPYPTKKHIDPAQEIFNRIYKEYDINSTNEANIESFRSRFPNPNEIYALTSAIKKRPSTSSLSLRNNDIHPSKFTGLETLNLVSAHGKRCCLGYYSFKINPDGMFFYDQWCHVSKATSIFNISPKNFDDFFIGEMKPCPQKYCHCNYNYFSYEHYLKSCYFLGYSYNEIFPPEGSGGEANNV